MSNQQVDLSALTAGMSADEVDRFYARVAGATVDAAAEIKAGRQARHEQALATQYQAELAAIKQGDVNSILALKKRYRALGLGVY